MKAGGQIKNLKINLISGGTIIWKWRVSILITEETAIYASQTGSSDLSIY